MRIVRQAAAVGFGGTRPLASRKLFDWQSVRTPLPGFPSSVKFTSVEEVDRYYGDDKVVCLLCGRAFGALASHLKVHGSNARQYKEMFGLPLSRGLVSGQVSQRYSEHSKNMAPEIKQRFMAAGLTAITSGAAHAVTQPNAGFACISRKQKFKPHYKFSVEFEEQVRAAHGSLKSIAKRFGCSHPYVKAVKSGRQRLATQ